MYNKLVLEYLKKHGQMLDRHIAKDTGIALPQIRLAITKLQNTKDVFSCNVINFEGGVAVEGILCRISGYIPPASAGRKPAVEAAAD